MTAHNNSSAGSSDEPEARCYNCDSWTGEELRICAKILKQTEPTDGCLKFFPDPLRWPDADHD